MYIFVIVNVLNLTMMTGGKGDMLMSEREPDNKQDNISLTLSLMSILITNMVILQIAITISAMPKAIAALQIITTILLAINRGSCRAAVRIATSFHRLTIVLLSKTNFLTVHLGACTPTPGHW